MYPVNYARYTPNFWGYIIVGTSITYVVASTDYLVQLRQSIQATKAVFHDEGRGDCCRLHYGICQIIFHS